MDTLDRDSLVARLLITIVRDAGGIIRVPRDSLVKELGGDTVYIQDDEEGGYILVLDVDDVLDKRVKQAVTQTKNLITELEGK